MLGKSVGRHGSATSVSEAYDRLLTSQNTDQALNANPHPLNTLVMAIPTTLCTRRAKARHHRHDAPDVTNAGRRHPSRPHQRRERQTRAKQRENQRGPSRTRQPRPVVRNGTPRRHPHLLLPKSTNLSLLCLPYRPSPRRRHRPMASRRRPMPLALTGRRRGRDQVYEPSRPCRNAHMDRRSVYQTLERRRLPPLDGTRPKRKTCRRWMGWKRQRFRSTPSLVSHLHSTSLHPSPTPRQRSLPEVSPVALDRQRASRHWASLESPRGHCHVSTRLVHEHRHRLLQAR